MKGKRIRLYNRGKLHTFLCCFCLLMPVLVLPVWAEVAEVVVPEVLRQNVLLEADSISYDEEMSEVLAEGNVEISTGESTLLADRVIYNRFSDLVSAVGNVVLMSPDGNVTFSDAMELTGDLRSGTIQAIKILFTDGSRLAANGGRMSRDGRSEVRKAVYSPCRICTDSRRRNPIWQIKAISVVHDKSLKRIFYKDAMLEAFGVPVLYFPFFTHPDPSVRRKTGFLAPSIVSNALLGPSYTQPFFFNISPYEDATVAPIFAGKEGIILTGQYRRSIEKGTLEVSGSTTRSGKISAVEPEIKREPKETRGHVFAEGLYSINSNWLAGMDINLATDRAYLSNYGFSETFQPADFASRFRAQSHLTNQLFLEKSEGRNYTNVGAVAFQTLNPGIDLKTVPYLLPIGTYVYRGPPGARGDYWLLDTNVRVLGREEGAQSQRFVVKGGWRYPYTSELGERYSFNVALRADAYRVGNPDPQVVGKTVYDFEGRILPEIHLDWRLPFARASSVGVIIVEPMAQLVWRPNYKTNSNIPNEDSLAFEFDDLNLFSVDRFPGLDRYEGGTRLNYGLRSQVNSEVFPDAEVMLGQVFRAQVDDTYSDGTGLNQTFSDYVGRWKIFPSRYVTLIHRFRLDQKSLATRSSSLQSTVGPGWLNGSVNYMKISDGPTDGLPTSREQISLTLNQRWIDNWHLGLSQLRDLSQNGGVLGNSLALTYYDDCTTFAAFVNRNYTSGPLAPPDTTVGFQITLKNLGAPIGHQVNIAGNNP